jgi:hypothetical protein
MDRSPEAVQATWCAVVLLLVLTMLTQLLRWTRRTRGRKTRGRHQIHRKKADNDRSSSSGGLYSFR